MLKTILTAAGCYFLVIFMPGAWAQSAQYRQTKPFELSGQQKGGCVMPEMPAAITYTRIGANGQPSHTTTPCREDEGTCGISLNTYANGSHMCIAGFRNQESCRTGDCKPGWRHRCTEGWWKKSETCLSGELKKAKLDFAKDMSGGARGAMAAQGQQGDPFSKQIEALKPELEARQKVGSENAQCGAVEPDAADIIRDVQAAARAGGISEFAGVNTGERLTIEKYIASYGSLDSAIRAYRGQVAKNQTPGLDCSASRQHAAMCETNRILVRGNQRVLDWLLCHKRARG